MSLRSIQDWISWAGVVVPLFGLAWAAIFYTVTHRREVQHQEFERFFQIMDQLGQHGGSIASKMAAAYELRKYPAYKEVIIRLCEQGRLEGPASDMLANELRLTAENMRRL